VRWVTYRAPDEGSERLGLIVGSSVHGLPESFSLLSVLSDGSLEQAADIARDSAAEIRPLGEVQVLAPLPRPPSVRDFMSFEAHLANALKASVLTIDPTWYEHPCFYFSNPAAVLGPDAQVAISPGSLTFDFELEVAVIIGREGTDVLPSEAGEYIAGYTIMCDWSARDLQRAEGPLRLGPAKGKDGATSLGPWLVTPDELAASRSGNGFDLSMDVRVNGARYGGGNWSEIHWSFEQMIAYASRGTRIVPGDVIGSGTVGTGCLVELRQLHGAEAFPWLSSGDEVELSISGLGSLRSRVAAPTPGLLSVEQLLRS
jgi:2-keto-4-pentenoate hydratase/2-oxohepta-3-ene-1,7-dioic acid hydratase in catechol pathway